MSDLRTAAQQGLDALYRWHMTDGETDDLMPAFEALRAALSQPAASGEPAECDSLKLCAVQGACLGQYGTKKQCANAQPAPAPAEPVAWIYQNANTEREYLVWQKGTGGRNWRPLYTASQGRGRN